MFIPPFDTIFLFIYLFMATKVPNGVSSAPVLDYDYLGSFENYLKDNPMNLDSGLSSIDPSKITTRFKPNFNPTRIDHLIDPYDYALEYLSDTSAEGRAKYLHYLEQGKYIQQMQMVAYENWYNSPEQQAMRQRAAGLNPDLVGVENSASASGAAPDGSGIAGLPTQEAIDAQKAAIEAQKIQNIATIVGSLTSVASLATSFSSFALLPKQQEMLSNQNTSFELSNLDSLKSMISSDISDSLASAVDLHLNSGSTSPFDYEAWFADEANFAPLNDVYGSFPLYSSALSMARKQSLRFHRNASELQKDSLSFDFDVSRILSDPRLTSSQKLTAIQLRPYTVACYESDKATNDLRKFLSGYEQKFKSDTYDSSVEALNASNQAAVSRSDYEAGYYSQADPVLVAQFEQYLRDSQLVSSKLERKINQGYLDMYDSDPNGYDGFRAAYLYGSNGGRSWQDAFILHSKDNIDTIIDSLVTEAHANKDTAKLRALISALGNVAGMPTDVSSWQQNKLGWSRFSNEMVSYIQALQKIADNIDSN